MNETASPYAVSLDGASNRSEAIALLLEQANQHSAAIAAQVLKLSGTSRLIEDLRTWLDAAFNEKLSGLDPAGKGTVDERKRRALHLCHGDERYCARERELRSLQEQKVREEAKHGEHERMFRLAITLLKVYGVEDRT